MALPLGPILLLAVVGGALFGGLDPRKKKKKNGALPPPLPTNGEAPEEQVVTCARLMDINADASMISIDGQMMPAEAADDFDVWALQEGKPVVTFVVCEPDPIALQAIQQLCMQRPEIAFYGAYVYRIPDGPAKMQATQQCVAANSLVSFLVSTPMSIDEGWVRQYSSSEIPELNLQPGGNIADVFAAVLAAANGVDDPRAFDIFVEG